MQTVSPISSMDWIRTKFKFIQKSNITNQSFYLPKCQLKVGELPPTDMLAIRSCFGWCEADGEEIDI